MRAHFMLIALTFGLAACDPEASIGPRTGDAIQAQEAAQLAAISAEDAAAVAALYAPDAIMMQPFTATQTGPEAIQASFQQLFDDPNGALTFTTEDVLLPSAGDYAITQGRYSVTYTDPTTSQPATMAGPYLTVWRHQDDDSWKIIRDISTPGAPPTAPETPTTPTTP